MPSPPDNWAPADAGGGSLSEKPLPEHPQYSPPPPPPPPQQQQQQQQRPLLSSFKSMDSGFLGGVALQKYRQAHASPPTQNSDDRSRPAASSSATGRRQRPIPAPINTSLSPVQRPPATQPEKKPSFVTPTDLHSPSSSAATGRRPPGMRLATEPTAVPKVDNHVERQKTRKGLPFLKNPMSTLLMRRKASQNVPDVRPLPLSADKEEPAYDPRIRGTRVHDFSAPRRGMPLSPQQTTRTTPYIGAASTPASEHSASPQLGSKNSGSSEAKVEPAGENVQSDPSVPLSASQDTLVNAASPPSRSNTQASPPDQQKGDLSSSDSASSSLPQRNASSSTAWSPSRAGSSARVARPRNISLSSDISMVSRMSGLPKHMKSTSSRFSFDMIGAAKQEKAMEERHRLHQAKKGEPEEPTHGNTRDSRFDDFDEDSFDYDAMMDDDGLEERIPGVNADYDDDGFDDGFYAEEDIDDPDNDQENFAGFSFQRSEANLRGLASQTLDDFASGSGSGGGSMTRSTPRQSQLQESPLPPPVSSPQAAGQQQQEPPQSELAGLGIEGLNIQESGPPVAGGRKQPGQVDDLYYDDGIVGFEDEFAEDLARPPSWEATPFDESIFDNNDTDQYGRPIAGAFAQAQSERQAALRASVKRESDMTSRFSAQSDVTRSTAHTSLSTDDHGRPPSLDTKGKGVAETSFQDNSNAGAAAPSPQEQGTMAAYQAALAAAAHKAAASGKFQWNGEEDTSSPSVNRETPSAQVAEGDSEPAAWKPDEYETGNDGDDYGYDDDFGYENMDDFELDDDAIIAEANASALANDSDGWYGQEFGFYSAPPSNGGHGGSSHKSGGGGHGSNRNSNNGSDIEYQYANGGVFGPKGGIEGTPGGRVVSREPNLTPITERSEYSNRNSIMSNLGGFPGYGGGFGTPIQSPGLAQLAIMSDTNDEMSLSSLLRLRSKAWGGSQASASQVSSRAGSPKSEPHSPWATAMPPSAPGPAATGNLQNHGRKGSFLSGISFDSADSAAASSPTLFKTVSAPGSGVSPVDPPDGTLPSPSVLARRSVSEAHRRPGSSGMAGDSPSHGRGGSGLGYYAPPSPVGVDGASAARRSSGLGHSLSHQSRSSADSISYSIEEEEGGETRWVMERRRVAESGQVEMEREVVEGGRI